MRPILTCEIVRDLLPGYVDKLTSPETNEAVETHLKGCADCRAIFASMTGAEPEPVPTAEQREVDYLKKVRDNRRRWVWGASVLALICVVGAVLYVRFRPNTPTVSYDAPSKTLVVCGNDRYDKLKLPETAEKAENLEVQDDNFHLSLFLPVLRTGDESMTEFLPSYIDNMDRSIRFIRTYLKENAPDSYPADLADKYVDTTVKMYRNAYPKDSYKYTVEEDRISLALGDGYWSREEIYLLALQSAAGATEWQQMGYAQYLGMCLDPYNESRAYLGSISVSPYYEAYLAAGGNPSVTTAQDRQLLMDAISYWCLTKGITGWGSAYESIPLSSTLHFSGEAGVNKPLLNGNAMSVCMAASFIGWLSDNYGFDIVSEFCFGQKTFREAFGTEYHTAYELWNESILARYGA